MAGTTINPYRFGGQLGYRRDGPNRLYVRERHLDTSRGRWLSRDPLGFGGGDWNTYKYVKNAPVVENDPSGMAPNCPGNRNLCGPDVTAATAYAMTALKLMFTTRWTNRNHRRSLCHDLVNAKINSGFGDVYDGTDSWDTLELHNHGWINAPPYQPPCATPPICSSTVMVQNKCFYAGSLNYVTYGTMFRLCHDYVDPTFTEYYMVDKIYKYKNFGTVADYIGSRDWAVRGFRGWPASGAPTTDRPLCSPLCKSVVGYTSGPLCFTVHWSQEFVLSCVAKQVIENTTD